MPCLEFLAQLRDYHHIFTTYGAAVIAVGGAADYQAQHLQDDGHPFPLLLDPDGELRQALGIESQLSRKELISWTSFRNYVSARRHQRQGKISRSHAEDRPAVAIVDADLRLTWGHVGTALGDYPSIDHIIAALPPPPDS